MTIIDQYTDSPLSVHQKYRLRHPEKIKAYNENHRKQRAVYQTKFIKEHPEKRSIEKKAQRHFPLAECCAYCGSTENLERAHFSYAQPEFYLTLCRKHHRMFDKPNPSPL